MCLCHNHPKREPLKMKLGKRISRKFKVSHRFWILLSTWIRLKGLVFTRLHSKVEKILTSYKLPISRGPRRSLKSQRLLEPARTISQRPKLSPVLCLVLPCQMKVWPPLVRVEIDFFSLSRPGRP